MDLEIKTTCYIYSKLLQDDHINHKYWDIRYIGNFLFLSMTIWGTRLIFETLRRSQLAISNFKKWQVWNPVTMGLGWQSRTIPIFMFWLMLVCQENPPAAWPATIESPLGSREIAVEPGAHRLGPRSMGSIWLWELTSYGRTSGYS